MEGPRRRELAELMPNHILCYEDRNKFLALMDSKSQPDHFGQDRGSTRPRLDDFFWT